MVTGLNRDTIFLVSAIADNDYPARVNVSPDEIFVSDGSKCDTGNILDIFGADNVVAITDPVYPVYVETNVMAGRTGPAEDGAGLPDWFICRSRPRTILSPRCRRRTST